MVLREFLTFALWRPEDCVSGEETHSSLRLPLTTGAMEADKDDDKWGTAARPHPTSALWRTGSPLSPSLPPCLSLLTSPSPRLSSALPHSATHASTSTETLWTRTPHLTPKTRDLLRSFVDDGLSPSAPALAPRLSLSTHTAQSNLSPPRLILRVSLSPSLPLFLSPALAPSPIPSARQKDDRRRDPP